MTPQQRIAGLRRGLGFAGSARRAVIRYMIAELEAEQLAPVKTIPERVAACDPKSKAPAPAVGKIAKDGAGSSSEARTRQCAAASPREVGPVSLTTGKPGHDAGEAGGSPATYVVRDVPVGESEAFTEHRTAAEIDRGDPLALIPDGAAGRQARQALRQAGYEIKQFGGMVYIDGALTGDPRLYS